MQDRSGLNFEVRNHEIAACMQSVSPYSYWQRMKELSVYDRSFLQNQSSRKLVRRPALKKPGYTVGWAFSIIIEGYVHG